MPREAGLFEASGGSPLRGYLILRQQGGNVPPQWIERSTESRRGRQADLAKALKEGRPADIVLAEDWELAFRKECFYRGIRILMELERGGHTKL
jgi:hypothetical protein